MNRIVRSIVATSVVVLFGSALFAVPPGPGSKHIRYSGTEVFLTSEPGFVKFLSQLTISIPSLQVDEYILLLDIETTIYAPLGDGYYIAGKGPILCNKDRSIIGEVSFVSRTHILTFTPEGFPLLWSIDVALTGVIWSGELAGVVLTENIYGGNTTNYPSYSGEVEGFMMVPQFVDMEVLKAMSD